MSDSTKTDEAFLAKRLAHLREKLIDLSKRNPLVSFKHSGRGVSFLRVIDESPDVLFAKLRSGEMTFEPLPDCDQEAEDEKTAEFRSALASARLTNEAYVAAMAELGEGEHDEEKAAEIERKLRAQVRAARAMPRLQVGGKLDIDAHARANGFDPSFELVADIAGDTGPKHRRDDKIRVLYTRESCDTRLRKIWDRVRSHEQEHGIHTLYVVFGFVQWRETDASAAKHLAPLLLMPAGITRRYLRGRQTYSISASDEDLMANFALRELLRRNFGIELPEMANDEAPCDYFRRVAAILAATPALRLHRLVTIAVLRFPAMALWRDLDPDRWPSRSLLQHDKTALLLGARSDDDANERAFPADYPVEDGRFEKHAIPLILPADVSQHSALLDAAFGRSLAIQGPPGTGKSQTIANLIAGAVDAGKCVLFCAEKSAALAVVAARLRDLGLAPLMLELHSDQAKKADVMASLASRLKEAPGRPSAELDQKRKAMKQQRDALRRYLQLLHQPIGGLDRPVNALLWRMLRLKSDLTGVLPPRFLEQRVPQADEITGADLDAACQSLRNLGAVAEEIRLLNGGLQATPWHAARGLPAAAFAQDQVRDALADAAAAIQPILDFMRGLSNDFAIDFPDVVAAAEPTLAAWAALPDAVAGLCPHRLRTALRKPEEMRQLAKRLVSFQALLDPCLAVHPDPLAADVDKLRALVAALREEGIEEISATSLSEQAAEAGRQASAHAEFHQKLRPLCACLGLDAASLDVTAIRALLVALRRLEQVDGTYWSCVSSALLEPGVEQVLQAAAADAAALAARLNVLSADADAQVWRNYGAEVLADCAATLAEARLAARLASSGYRRARRMGRSIVRDRKQRAALAALLKRLAEWQADFESFRSQRRMWQLLGQAWLDLETDFPVLESMVALLRSVSSLLQPVGLGHVLPRLIDQSAVRREALAAGLHKDPASALLINGCNMSLPLQATRDAAEADAARLDALDRLVRAAGVRSDVVIATHAKSAEAMIASLQRLHTDLASPPREDADWAWYRGAEEDPLTLERAVSCAEALLNRADLPAAMRQRLAADSEPLAMLSDLAARAAVGMDLVSAQRRAWSRFEHLADVDAAAFLAAPDGGDARWSMAANRIEQALADEAGLRAFADLSKYLHAVEAAGTRFLYDAFVEADRPLTCT